MGVHCEMAVYTGYGHGITKPKSQRAVLSHNKDWFGKHYLDFPQCTRVQTPQRRTQLAATVLVFLPSVSSYMFAAQVTTYSVDLLQILGCLAARLPIVPKLSCSLHVI